jgi:hypothetical protein
MINLTQFQHLQKGVSIKQEPFLAPISFPEVNDADESKYFVSETSY